ncbi:hypothetical protein EVAR_74298_1 [Eumeta japonica]|uniref:Endonuclease/exonuclease/phosphatase domain-containing protein n=1 Tax=Eumeta variegata TaxID=151549 RepID=A0A4C1SDK7_EUMVA|nr:hypothetical protein EVAR_74298_1 [Eumeta japonica]
MATLDVVPLNIGNTPTYTKVGASSIVDLTFVSSSLTRNSHCWKVLNTYTASDHSAIRWEVSTGQNPRRVNKQTCGVGWKVKLFDPAALMVALDCESFIIESAEEKTENLMKRVTQACDAKCLKKRRIFQRGYQRPNSAELVAEHKKTRRELNKAIKDSKRRCWKELVEEVEKDPWGRPYKVVMSHLKSQSMPSLTSPKLLQKIMTALFPQQYQFDYPTAQNESEDIPTVTEKELMDACN